MATPKNNPPGFYSYKHLEGNDRTYLNNLRSNLEDDLLAITGLPIKLWQDVDDIKWGQEWRKAIDKGLAEAAFFIPVITPGYLYSDVCRSEFEKFANYEKKRKRTDLILPLIYVRPDDFDDKHRQKEDSIIRLCLERQYVNWEDLRGLGDEGPEYRTRLTTLSKRIRDLLKTLPQSDAVGTARATKKAANKRKLVRRRKSGAAPASSSAPLTLSSVAPEQDDVAPPVQRTLYVNRLGYPGTFQTIMSAVGAARAGDRILIAPGHYIEAISLAKPLVIVGEGNLGEVTVSTKDAVVVESTTQFGRVENLVLHQNGGKGYYCIDVKVGSLEISGCDVTSASLSCMRVASGAEVRVRRSRVHGSPQSGIAFFKNARGVVEESEIYDNGFAGIALVGSADVSIRSNKIRSGRSEGVLVTENGRGLIEDNEISGNRLAGVEVSDSGDPTVRRNRIYDGTQCGVIVIRNGAGTIIENKIFGNGYSGVEVSGAAPTVSDNDIYDNKGAGIYCYELGSGVIENNRVRQNAYSGAVVSGGAKPQLRNNHFIENSGFGIRISSGGGGVYEGNEMKGNVAGGKSIDETSVEVVQWKD
jgi:parallel beta-helix repeat protein